MADGALRQMGESILGRQGVDKLTRMVVHGDRTGAEGHISTGSNGCLPASTTGSEALRHSGGARGGGEGDNWWLEAAGDTEAPAEEKGGGSVPTL
jgi:hypothetical protein